MRVYGVRAALCTMFLFLIPAGLISAPAQEWMGFLDKSLAVPEGLMTGRLTVSGKTGRSQVWDFNLYKKHTDLLYLFSTKRRGLELKLLYKSGGEVCWMWDLLRASLFRKRDLEKFEPVLGSGFSFMDLSGALYESQYEPVDLREASTMVLKIKPVLPSGYTEILAQMDREKKRPLRIDFHGKDKILIKTMRFTYDLPLLDPRARKRISMAAPAVQDVIDLETGRISRIEFFSLDRAVSPDDSLFIPEFLNR
ncbi:MAG TPA: outer membrane lipoprotein-sorting protein [Leptospiraceae bacterium]|nr:outer membrane lipoprotein-sorting protein [Leptospiraceae bacterium]HMX57692.1 outer membrane lipoprotein-sorting protein [Leptospiraceae bacterium]HMY45215.1 outer membrane lipoprotein-sorting protein [Leptospiraceae bacterium]HNE22523.1 outer membrane lipoprotein-sorting protein [Leptospiraceae bacterium]HNL00851.1 outer membrane lipoprotein-sorting protein [Leptospiraceae bacterium]